MKRNIIIVEAHIVDLTSRNFNTKVAFRNNKDYDLRFCELFVDEYNKVVNLVNLYYKDLRQVKCESDINSYRDELETATYELFFNTSRSIQNKMITRTSSSLQDAPFGIGCCGGLNTKGFLYISSASYSEKKSIAEDTLNELESKYDSLIDRSIAELKLWNEYSAKYGMSNKASEDIRDKFYRTEEELKMLKKEISAATRKFKIADDYYYESLKRIKRIETFNHE